MSNVEAIELNQRALPNGHVLISYKAGGQVFYDEYPTKEDAQLKNKATIISRAYAKKNKIGRNMLVYIDPTKEKDRSKVLKILTYDKQNKLSEEIVFNNAGTKVLSRFYANGLLDQDWSFDPETGKLVSGFQYKKNKSGKYDITSISTPIYNSTGELSHTIQKKTNPSGEPTGEVLQRVFYICNLPFVRVNYTENPKNPMKPDARIYSLDDGEWNLVKNDTVIKHLIPILEDAIAFEGDNMPKRSFLNTHSNIYFEELTYNDVLEFKKINPSVKILKTNQIGYIPSEDEKQIQLEQLSEKERQFVEKAMNAGYFVLLNPLKES